LEGVIEMQKTSREVVTIKKIQNEVNRVLEKHKSSTDTWYSNRFMTQKSADVVTSSKPVAFDAAVKKIYA
jgi:hypothetical protein